jgi:hypothetical protein
MKEVDMLLGMIDDMQITEQRVIEVLCRWLGREQVRDMMLANGWLDEATHGGDRVGWAQEMRFRQQILDGQPDEAQEWYDFDPEC